MALLYAIISRSAARRAAAAAGAAALGQCVLQKAQLLSAGYMGFAHGTNDAQKTMGIIALALFGAQAAGTLDNLPSWLAFLHPHGGEEATSTAGSSSPARW